MTGALYAVPAVDQHRETSIVSVKTNGGNVERFRISVPVPADLDWPDDPRLRSANAEVFKLRNERDAVVGVAARVAALGADGEPVIEWVLHLPARGSVYITMSSQSDPNGVRTGTLRGGTREFAARAGSMAERFVPASREDGSAGGEGQIELSTSFVGTESELE